MVHGHSEAVYHPYMKWEKEIKANDSVRTQSFAIKPLRLLI